MATCMFMHFVKITFVIIYIVANNQKLIYEVCFLFSFLFVGRCQYEGIKKCKVQI